MPCAIHDWYFDTPCPKCVAATVTVTETPPAAPSQHAGEPTPSVPAGAPLQSGGQEVQGDFGVAPEIADSAAAMPEIPSFLRRNPDNTFVEPEPWGELKPFVPRTLPPAEDIAEWPDEKLHAALSANLSIDERQPILREMTRRENKTKTYARLDKAGFTKPKDENESGEPE